MEASREGFRLAQLCLHILYVILTFDWNFLSFYTICQLLSLKNICIKSCSYYNFFCVFDLKKFHNDVAIKILGLVYESCMQHNDLHADLIVFFK